MRKVNKIYLLPNLLTTANFFCGIWAITLVFKEMYPQAALLIMIAMLFDFMDGHVARLSKAITSFGTEYDSLSDLVSFGIAPGVMIYSMVLSDLGRLGLAVFFIYTVSVCLRLARFNSKLGVGEKTSFTGLPSPAAAGLIASSVIVFHKYNFEKMTIVLPFIMVIIAYLMVSNFKYEKINKFIWKRDFLHLVFIILAVAAFLFYAELCILVLFASYSFSGLLAALLEKLREKHYLGLSPRVHHDQEKSIAEPASVKRRSSPGRKYKNKENL